MKKILFRSSVTIFAILIGVGIVLGLSYFGNQTKGPVEDVLEMTSNVVDKVEESIIIQPRLQKRSDKLAWLNSYKNKKSLLNPEKMLIGAFDNQSSTSYKSIIKLEDTLHTTFPLVHIYAAWGSKQTQTFPTAEARSIIALGSIPVITWEPWLTDFSNENIPNLRAVNERDKGGMLDIANGIYDSYIVKWAAAAKKIGSPIFLRFGHEMNDAYRYPWGPQNNAGNDFVAAWKHVHDIFNAGGATNIIWVWSPHPAYGFFSAYYPGNDYVDYIGSGTLNYGSVANWSKWWSFDEIFGKYYTELAHFGKPIMLTEFGCLEVGGNRSKWFNDAFTGIQTKYPAVKSLLFFHYSDDNTTTQQSLNWYFINDSNSVKVIRNQLTKL